MTFVPLIFLVAAFLLFLFAAFGVNSQRFDLTNAGLACWVLSQLLGMGLK